MTNTATDITALDITDPWNVPYISCGWYPHNRPATHTIDTYKGEVDVCTLCYNRLVRDAQ